MKEYRYTVVYERAEEGGWIAYVPALPSCHTQGETLEEAKEMIKDVTALVIEHMRAGGIPIPDEPEAPRLQDFSGIVSGPGDLSTYSHYMDDFGR